MAEKYLPKTPTHTHTHTYIHTPFTNWNIHENIVKGVCVCVCGGV
jgi:hypothetical protein